MQRRVSFIKFMNILCIMYVCSLFLSYSAFKRNICREVYPFSMLIIDLPIAKWYTFSFIFFNNKRKKALKVTSVLFNFTERMQQS